MPAKTMRAARFDRASRQLTLQNVPVPQPGWGEVLVRVEAAGICLSDVHMIEGTLPPPALPQATPGHEAAGTIAQVGPGVTFWQPGQRVVMAGGKELRRLPPLRHGRLRGLPHPPDHGTGLRWRLGRVCRRALPRADGRPRASADRAGRDLR